jgi:hypothetical protein
MDIHKNGPLTPKGPEVMVRAVIDWGCPKPRLRAAVQRRPEVRRQMGQTLPLRGARRLARPLVSASFIAKPNGARHTRGDRGFAAAAPTRESRSQPRSACRRRPSAASLRRLGLNRLSALEPALRNQAGTN